MELEYPSLEIIIPYYVKYENWNKVNLIIKKKTPYFEIPPETQG